MSLEQIVGPSPWTRLHDLIKPAGIALAFMAIGAVGQAIYDGSAELPRLHRQAGAADWFQSVASCEAWRARILKDAAVDANAEGVDVNLSGVPNCPVPPPLPKTAVPPSATPVPK